MAELIPVQGDIGASARAELLRIATRGSALALVQATSVRDALVSAGEAAELVIVETAGDRRLPDTPWGEGAFVTAIEQALRDGRADIAVHSAKDVPLDGHADLVIAAFLERADPRDALVVRAGTTGVTRLEELPHGAVVGTDSPRRAAFCRDVRPDLVVRPIHGNVDTRLRRLDAGEADALILAVAGLERLGQGHRITARLDARIIPPAPGQGAIAVQVRATDGHARTAVATLDHVATRAAVEAERAFLDACGGGCRAPIGALARVEGDGLRISVGIGDGGSRVARGDGDVGPDGSRLLGERLVADLAGPDAPVVLVTRPTDQRLPLMRALAELGVAAAPVAAIATVPMGPAPLRDGLVGLPSGAWVVVTSPTGARIVGAVAAHLGRGDLRWAAVGEATALQLVRAGLTGIWTPSRPDGRAIAEELPADPGASVLLVRGDLADPELAATLERRGAIVREVTAYRTVEAPGSSRPQLAEALQRDPAAVMLASGSAVRGLLTLAGPAAETLRRLPALCIGPTTAAVAREAGFRDVCVARRPSDEALAELAAATVALRP